MKKITFLVVCFILSLGYVYSQDDFLGTDVPEVSTGEDGPWYYIQVIGTDAQREHRVFTVEDIGGDSLKVFSRPKSAESYDAIESQLWRFETGVMENSYIVINKKYPDLFLEQGAWEAKNNQTILLLKEDMSTEWELRERTDGGGFYHIISTVPINSSYFSAHMGNSGFSYSVVLEGDTYGYGANSQFRFVEYFDPGLDVSQTTVDFQYRQDSDHQIDINVLGYASLTEDIVCELINNENEAFAQIPAEQEWNARTGGKIQLFFLPPDGITSPTEYTAILRLSSKTEEKDLVIDVQLKATGMPLMPFVTSPSVSASAEDKWYAIRLSKRTGGYLQDLGADTEGKNLVTGMLTSREDESMQWKFVNIDGVNFKLVSKLGNELEWNPDTYEPDPETGENTKVVGNFYTKQNTTNTFKFVVRPTDGFYQIKWNERKTWNEEADSTAYINKSNSHEGFLHYTSLTDDGSFMEFFPIENAPISKVMKFSDDTNITWYYMMFQRVLTNKKENIGIQSQGLGYLVQDTIIKDDPSFQWKLVGNAESCRVVNQDGYEFGNTYEEDGITVSAYSRALVPQGEGNDYTFVRFKQNFNQVYGVEAWKLRNLEEGRENQYINDFENKANAVSEYTADDAGNELIFVAVEDFFFLDVENITPGEDLNDPVVSTSYYSLQGVQFAKLPKAEGFYVEKNIHASGKVSSSKLYVPAQPK